MNMKYFRLNLLRSTFLSFGIALAKGDLELLLAKERQDAFGLMIADLDIS